MRKHKEGAEHRYDAKRKDFMMSEKTFVEEMYRKCGGRCSRLEAQRQQTSGH